MHTIYLWRVLGLGLASAFLAPHALAQAEGQTPTVQEPESNVEKSNRLRKVAYAAVQKGLHAKAAEAFTSLLSLEPTNPDWVLEAADSLGKAGMYNDAMDLLDGAQESFPDVPKIVLMLARTFHLKADSMVADGIRDQNVTFYYEDAARTAKIVLQKDPNQLEARLLVASAAYQLGRYDNALKNAQLALEGHPNSYGAYAVIGKLRFAQFVAARQRMASEKPKGKAKTALNAEIYKLQLATRSALEKAAEADPNRSFPHQKLADLAAWTGRPNSALARYSSALAIQPRCSIDHSWLRSNYKATDLIEMYAGAVIEYQKRPNATPDKAAVLVWYGARANYDLQKWSQSAALFKLALQGLPDYHETLYYLMQASYWQSDSDAAALYAVKFATVAPRMFADMIRKDDQIQAVLKGIAAARFEKDDLVSSREINHVLAFAKQTADEWNNYAFLCRETLQYEESYAAYKVALGIEVSPQLLNDTAVILQYHLRSEANDRIARDYYEHAKKLAKEMLEDKSLSKTVRERTKTALQDAKDNLRKFGRRGK